MESRKGVKVPDPAHERPENPIFYSELMRAVERLGLEKASGTQWLGTLNNLRGVKKEEMRWVGLPEWLAERQGPVTKGEVLDFLSAREVRVEEVVKGGESFAEVVREVAFDRGYWAQIENKVDPDYGKWVVMFRDAECGVFVTEHEAEQALLGEARDFLSEPGKREEYMNLDTAYSKYQIPGGDRYRELLLTLPMMTGDEDVTGRAYYSPHFNEANVLVHVRFNERTDTGGKRLLFVEEVQSDWHQQGRWQGYREGKPKAVTYKDYAAHQGIAEEEAREIENRNDPSDPQWVEMRLWMAEESRERQLSWSAKLPNGPFKTSWPELALKRMLRWGTEHGFDRLGWTMGEQQARRYDDEAGEGMYRFYDKVLPAVANKYGKLWGVKATKTSIDTGPSPYRLHYENDFWQVYEGDHSVGGPIGTREDAHEFLHWLEREAALGGVIEVHALDITPGLRDSVLQGQPLFLAFGSGAPGKAQAISTERGKGMTREQINREMQEADRIRAGMLARVAERVGKEVGELREGTAAEIYGKIQDVVSGPLADIRRRVVEEPTYGKTIFDVVYDRQHQGNIWGKDDKPVDQEPEPTAQGAQKSQSEREMDDIMQRFYGPQQNPGQDRGPDNGMEP